MSLFFYKKNVIVIIEILQKGGVLMPAVIVPSPSEMAMGPGGPMGPSGRPGGGGGWYGYTAPGAPARFVARSSGWYGYGGRAAPGGWYGYGRPHIPIRTGWMGYAPPPGGMPPSPNADPNPAWFTPGHAYVPPAGGYYGRRGFFGRGFFGRFGWFGPSWYSRPGHYATGKQQTGATYSSASMRPSLWYRFKSWLTLRGRW